MIRMHGKKHWFRPHEWEGYIELAVDDNHYVFPCPHCSPSYFTLDGSILDKSRICYNANTEICKKCYEAGCEYSQVHGVQEVHEVPLPLVRRGTPICPECGCEIVRIVYKDDECTEVDFYDCTWCSHVWKPDDGE